MAQMAQSKISASPKNHLGGYSFRLDLNAAQAKGVDDLMSRGLHGFSSAEVVLRILDEKLISVTCERNRGK